MEYNMSKFLRRDVLRGGAGAGLFLASLDQALLGEAFAQGVPKRGGTLSYAQLSANRRAADASNAKHPYNVVDANTRLQWNCLTWVNEKLGWELELASKIEPTDDRLIVWDVTLREGVLFHNGTEMTANDVVSSFEYHRRNAPFARQNPAATREWLVFVDQHCHSGHRSSKFIA